MNNINKLIKSSLRRKYLRAPTLEDIEVTYDPDYITLTVGQQSRWVYFKKKTTAYTRLCNKFNSNKTELKLKEIIKAMKKEQSSCRVSYESLFRPGIKKGLFNKEGIDYLKLLKIKLKQIRSRFDSAFTDLTNLEVEIKFVDPYADTIFSIGRNYHSREIKWIVAKIDGIINKNKSENTVDFLE